jgi:O-antigen/teichoic acid export membrane protein
MLKNSLIYFSGSVINKLIPFAVLPVLTRYLTPEEYGLIALLQVAISLTSAVIGMNIKVNITREYYHVSAEEFRQCMTAICTVATASFLFIQVAFLIFLGFEMNPFGIPDRWLAAVPFISFMTILNGFNLTLERVKERAWRYFGLDVSSSVATALLTLLLVIPLRMGWEGQAISLTTCSIAYGIFGLYAMVRGTGISRVIDRNKVWEMLRISVPLFPHALSSTVIVMSDRLFIDRLIGTESTGIYTVGYQIGAVTFIFSQAYMNAWSPWFYRQMKEPSNTTKTHIVRLTYASLAGILALTIVYSLVATALLPYIVDSRFLGASEYITWVSLSCIAYAVYQWFFPYLVLAKRTSYLAFSSTAAMLVNLVLNYFLIIKFGAIGAAYATFIAYMVSAMLVVLAANRYIRMPWLNFR